MVIVNGDLLDQLSDEDFVEFGDFGLLTTDEVLQLVEPCLDTVRAHRVGGYYRFCDVLLHLPEETVAIGEYPIEGLDRDLLQQVFLDDPAGAVHDGAAGFKAADASPDDTFAAVVIPVDSPVDSLDDLCLFRVDDEVPVAVLGISEKVIVIDLYLSLLVAVL